MLKNEWICAKKKQLLWMAVCIGLITAAAFYIYGKKQEQLQKGIAEEVLRFHVLANSDSEGDQELKLRVRDYLLDYMEGLLNECRTVEDTKYILEKHLEDIEKTAEEYIKRTGREYAVTAELVEEEFPEKIYGDCRFPAGTYEALRINIGEAKGRNWWCMIYPGLCFTEEGGAWVDSENKALMKHVLTEEEFRLVAGENKLKITLKLPKLFLRDQGA